MFTTEIWHIVEVNFPFTNRIKVHNLVLCTHMFSVVYVYQYFYWDFNIFWISKKKELYRLLWNFCTKTCLFNIICSKLIICFISFNFNGDILFYLWNIFSTNHNFFCSTVAVEYIYLWTYTKVHFWRIIVSVFMALNGRCFTLLYALFEVCSMVGVLCSI